MADNFVYILLSEKDKKTYVGSTNNLKQRIEEHQRGLVISTKKRLPLKLIYSESFSTIEEARKKERFFKTAWGRRKLRERIDPIIKNGPVV